MKKTCAGPNAVIERLLGDFGEVAHTDRLLSVFASQRGQFRRCVEGNDAIAAANEFLCVAAGPATGVKDQAAGRNGGQKAFI